LTKVTRPDEAVMAGIWVAPAATGPLEAVKPRVGMFVLLSLYIGKSHHQSHLEWLR
jgi:hypothetical protein